MRYNCFHCGKTLNIPSGVEVEAKLQPIRLKCPHCGSQVTFNFRAAHLESREQLTLGLDRLLLIFRFLRNSFLTEHISNESHPAMQSKLSAHILDIFYRKRMGTSFFLLSLLGGLFFMAGLWELCVNSRLNPVLAWSSWLGAASIFGLVALLFHYFGGNFLSRFGSLQDRNSLPQLLHFFVAASFLLFWLYLFRWLAAEGHLDLGQSKKQAVAMAGWLAFPAWYVTVNVLYFITARQIHFYLGLMAMMAFHLAELYILVRADVGGLGLWFLGGYQLIGKQLALGTMVLFVIHVFVGPFLSFLLLRTAAFVRSRHFIPRFERHSVVWILLQFLPISLFGFYAGPLWEFTFFYGLFLFLGALFYVVSILNKHPLLFAIGTWSVFLAGLCVWRMTYLTTELALFTMMVPVLTVFFIPNVAVRFWRTPGGFASRRDIDLIPDQEYVSRRAWHWQSLGAGYIAVLGLIQLYGQDELFYLGTFIFLIGCALLYINQNRSAYSPKFLGWFFIVQASVAVVLQTKMYGFGVAWFVLAGVFAALAFLWKIYFSDSFYEQLQLNFHDVSPHKPTPAEIVPAKADSAKETQQVKKNSG